MSYIKKARESKRQFILLTMILGMIYGLQFLCEVKFGQINHLYLLTGGFSIWLVLNIFASEQLMIGHSRKTNWYKSIISFVGYFACFGSFLIAVVLILPLLETFPPEVIARTLFLFKLNIILLVYISACIIFVWSKYAVKDETFVILHDKVLYPGQEYEILSFVDYEASVMKKNFQLSLNAMELICKNDKLKVTISSSMAFDIEEAKRQGINTFDFSTFYVEAKNCLNILIQKQAESMNVSEVIEGNMESRKLNIAGFPVIWNGNIQALVS